MRDRISETALSDLLSAHGCPTAEIAVYDTLPSTNDALRALALAGAPHGSVVWAHTQSAGKGSRGRSFCSPVGGLYLSVLLRSYTDPMQITCAAAVATHEAIRRVLGISTDIKWVNDLYLYGRKICGILCEGITVGSSLSAAVLGIGINLATPTDSFPDSLRTVAGALLPSPPPQRTTLTLIAELIALLHSYLSDPSRAYMHCYRTHNLVLGRTVRYRVGNTEQTAYVQEITERGTLRLLCENGLVCEAFSGEVLFH